MTMMTNLPRDLVDEILCRTPVTSSRRIRSTCKKWKTLFKDGCFTKKHLAHASAEREEEFLAVLLINCKLYLMSVNLHGIHNDYYPFIRPTGNLISLNDSDKLEITRVYHCHGLLLCVTEDYKRLVLWNPYSGENRWICVQRPADHRGMWYNHALGCDQSTHKILKFFNLAGLETYLHEIYNVDTNSWRVLDVTPDWHIEFIYYGLTVKGNTYWYGSDKGSREIPDFLLCFDFTNERFAPRLHLPFQCYSEDTVCLSSVREEQLAVMLQNCATYKMEVWVTTKIEPNVVSWSKFLAVDVEPLTRSIFFSGGSFILIDDDEEEEKRAVIVFDRDYASGKAYFFGENDYFRQVDLGERCGKFYPHAFSYVPSSVQINQPA